MSTSVRFAKVCPTCGRTLQIPVELLGKDVACQGCGVEFKATTADTPKIANPSPTTGSPANAFEGIDERVDRLIQAADRQLQHFSSPAHS
jgi:hypothetical protein